MHFLFDFKAGVRRKRIILVTRTSNRGWGLFWDLIGLLLRLQSVPNRWDTVAAASAPAARAEAFLPFGSVDCSWAFTLARTNNLEEPRTLLLRRLSLFLLPSLSLQPLSPSSCASRDLGNSSSRRVHKFVLFFWLQLVWKCLCNKKVKASDPWKSLPPWDWTSGCVIHFEQSESIWRIFQSFRILMKKL